MRMLIVLVSLLITAMVHAQTPPCPFSAGALPAATLPAGTPHGAGLPLDTIVVLMQENRSFDHYVGRLHAEGKPKSEGEPKTAANLDPTGGPAIRAFHQNRYCEVADLDHSWNGTHREWNGGAMDGFTAANQFLPDDPSGRRTMGYYDQHDLPFYYGLYRKFATADRFFCAALTQTFPNRFYLLAATSFGHIRNDLPPTPTDFVPPGGTIFERLDAAGVTWKVYASQFAFAIEFAYVRNQHASQVVPVAQFESDAQAGTLPQVAWIDPIFLGTEVAENDEHPPANIQIGQQFVAKMIATLFASPQWPRSALFLTYDEHGGFFDHVPPPPACRPDDIAPILESGDEPGEFDRYGIRVPMALVSPFARRHFVSHTAYDHTSVLRFIETRFDLPALTARDANADPMLELFDFQHPRFRKPPKLPKAKIDPKRLAGCSG